MDSPAIFELNEHHEATGTVIHFCSEPCADGFRMDLLDPLSQFPMYTWGRSRPSDGEICVTCGVEL